MITREIRQTILRSREARIAVLAISTIAIHLLLRYALSWGSTVAFGGLRVFDLPLLVGLVLGGAPLVWTLLRQALRGEFGSDLLAGISIVTAILLGEYLAGTLVVLMLSGGQALEAYAVRSASSVLEALAKRMPAIAHRREGAEILDAALGEISVGDLLVVFPHEICPVDGEVEEGHGSMDESYLTGEPFRIEKTPGSSVLSGAVNGDTVLNVRATKRAIDSRYSMIMEVMRASEQRRPRLRRLGDQLGAIYTPVAVALAIAAWVISGGRIRFLAVLVVATPCPLLIAIPVAIIGSISLAAKRGIIIKDPAVLERISTCRTAIFDKTGTLTYGQPQLTEVAALPGFAADAVLASVASLERYSRHPLSGAILDAAKARALALVPATAIGERAGEGLSGTVAGRTIRVGSRSGLAKESPDLV
jgi:cation transport ATPase